MNIYRYFVQLFWPIPYMHLPKTPLGELIYLMYKVLHNIKNIFKDQANFLIFLIFLSNAQAHALYAPSNIPEKDEFLTHRLTQLYELSEFVRLTSGAADLVLVTGDFNSEPFSLATKLAISNARLLDAWETRGNKEVSFVYEHISKMNDYRVLRNQIKENSATLLNCLIFVWIYIILNCLK